MLSMMSSDPRVHKPRLPKAYTVPQIEFLKASLPEFQRRSEANVRGDAKKYALEMAQDFIVRFGLPDEFIGVEEAEPRFKEQIYNWFKNTVGRQRRKLEGRPRATKKASEKSASRAANIGVAASRHYDSRGLHTARSPALAAASSSQQQQATTGDLQWTSHTPATANIGSTSHVVAYQTHAESTTSSPVNQTNTLISPIQYSSIQPSSSSIGTALSVSTPGPSHTLTSLGLTITQNTLRDAFSSLLDPSTLGTMIQNFILASPSSETPLTPVVKALFDAISADTSPNTFSRDPRPYLERFLAASNYFPNTIVHAGVAGPLAGPRALQMQIRKNSVWHPSPSRSSASSSSTPGVAGSGARGSSAHGPSSSTSLSLSDEMQRIALDRQRRKDHIQWARIHASVLELHIPLTRSSNEVDSGYVYAMGRAFSEMTARDAVWEEDEVEWVAGICVLRAVIRTMIDVRMREEYDELLRTYEGRWKEIKDEARQALVTEVLLSAKDDLARVERVDNRLA